MYFSFRFGRAFFDELLGTTSTNGSFLSIGDEKVRCNFDYDGDRTAKLTSPVMIPVPAGTVVNKIGVGRFITIGNEYIRSFTVELTGNAIYTFNENGIYVINTLEVKLEG